MAKQLRILELNKLLQDMQSEKAAVVRRRRRNHKNRDYAGSGDYSYTPEAAEKTAGG